jgi:hypothetical protein
VWIRAVNPGHLLTLANKTLEPAVCPVWAGWQGESRGISEIVMNAAGRGYILQPRGRRARRQPSLTHAHHSIDGNACCLVVLAGSLPPHRLFTTLGLAQKETVSIPMGVNGFRQDPTLLSAEADPEGLQFPSLLSGGRLY